MPDGVKPLIETPPGMKPAQEEKERMFVMPKEFRGKAGLERSMTPLVAQTSTQSSKTPASSIAPTPKPPSVPTPPVAPAGAFAPRPPVRAKPRVSKPILMGGMILIILIIVGAVFVLMSLRK